MKPGVRVLAIDDGPHRPSDDEAPIVGVVCRSPDYVEGILVRRAEVDGDDGTRQVVRMLQGSRFRPTVRLVLLNGVFVAGLNLVDPHEVTRRTGLPVVALTRKAPRPALVDGAIRSALPNSEALRQRVAQLSPVRLPGTSLWASVSGLDAREAAAAIAALCVRGNWPEPLRLAHVIASGFVRGESRGRA